MLASAVRDGMYLGFEHKEFFDLDDNEIDGICRKRAIKIIESYVKKWKKIN